jgi:hypothetical protein
MDISFLKNLDNKNAHSLADFLKQKEYDTHVQNGILCYKKDDNKTIFKVPQKHEIFPDIVYHVDEFSGFQRGV